jgi:PrcB C-terminal
MLGLSLLLPALLVADTEPASSPRVIARGPWAYVTASGDEKAQQLVIKSAADLVKNTPFKDRDAEAKVVEKAATAEVAKALKVKDIDWAKQMLVVVTAGTKGSGGYRIEITGLKVKDKELIVSWKLHAPKGAATAALTHPATMALVPRFTGKAVFDPPAKK